VGGIKGPVARGMYWFDQHVIDAIVNFVASFTRRTGNVVYRYIDQGAIDGTVNGSGLGAGNLGGILRVIQTGRVQTYGTLLFLAAATLAGVLVLTTSS
jgi:NADH-quinone oxidoreductase subunit L